MGTLKTLWRRLTGRETADALAQAEARLTKALDARLDRMRPYLAGAAPGLWASNHMEETRNHYTGWNFCAIRAIARMASNATVTVHQTGLPEPMLRLRAAKRAAAQDNARAAALFAAGRLPFGYLSEVRAANKELVKKAMADALAPTHTETHRRPLPDTHALSKLLKKPNPSQTGASMRYQIIQQLCLTGSGLVWNVPNAAGVPVERYAIPTALATPLAPTEEYPHGRYRVIPMAAYATLGTSNQAEPDWAVGTAGVLFLTGGILDARQVQAYRWPHPVYLADGLSPLSAGSLWVDTADQIDRSRWSAMVNSPNPGLIINEEKDADTTAEDREALREQLQQRFAGPNNAGRSLYLPPGLKAAPWAATPKELEHANAFEQMRDSVFALHGLPPVAAGVMTANTYAALYAALQQATELTLVPTLNLLADDDTEKLGPHWGPGIEVGYRAKPVNDPELQLRQQDLTVRARALTVNEFRMQLGHPPTEEAWGNERVGDAPKSSPSGKPAAEGRDPNATEPLKDETDETHTGVGEPTRDALNDVKTLLERRNGTNGHHAGPFVG